MSATDLARAIGLRWRLELLIALVIGGAALALAVATPRASIATTTLMVDQRPVEADIAPGAEPPPVDMDLLLGAQADLARSGRVVAAAVRDPAVVGDRALRARWRRATGGRTPFATWAADRLAAQLTVDHEHGSNLLHLQVSAADPDSAARLANAAARAYLAAQRRIATDPARTYAAWYRARTDEARAGLEAAQAALVAFQHAHGLTATPSLDAEGERLQALTQQMALADGAQAESAARAASDGAGTAGAQASRSMDVLRTALAEQAAKVAELGKRLGPRHPEMIAADTTLARLRDEAAAIRQDVAASQRIDSAGADRRAAALRRLVAAQRGRILARQADQARLDLLQRDVQSASVGYDAVRTRLAAMRLQAEAPRTNVRQLDLATPAAGGGRGQIVMRGVLGLILGLAIGITVAVGLEWLDPRVRSSATIAQLVSAPVLVRVPLGTMRLPVANARAEAA